MAGWIAVNHKSKPIVFQRIEKEMNCVFSPKSAINLMQNCDLPPPIKLFSGPDGVFLSSISKIYGMGGGLEAEDDQTFIYKDCSGDDKLEVLKALRLSQTRAREAERKLRVLSKEKDVLSNLLVDESMRLFAYRQCVNLMEFEVVKLQKQQQQNENRESHYNVSNFAEKSSKLDDYDEGCSSKKWWAVCLAIAGIGFAFGCRYLF